MTCDELEKGSRWIDIGLGEMSPELSRGAEEHLAACEGCRRRLAEARAGLFLFRQLPVAEGLRFDDLVREYDDSPPLPGKLQVSLLAIPTSDNAKAREVGVSGEEKAREVGVIRRCLEWFSPLVSSWRIASPVLACAVLLLFLELPRTEDIEKGPGDGAPPVARLAQIPVGLELVTRGEAGDVERLEVEPLEDGAAGVVLRPDMWVQPVFVSPEADLSIGSYFAVVLAINEAGDAEVFVNKAEAGKVLKLPGTQHLFTLPSTFRLMTSTGRTSQRWRLFVLLGARAIREEEIKLRVRAGFQGQVIEPWSILEPAEVEAGAIEATMLVEVR